MPSIPVPSHQRARDRAHGNRDWMARSSSDGFSESGHRPVMQFLVEKAELRYLKGVFRIQRGHIDARVRVAGEQKELIGLPTFRRERGCHCLAEAWRECQ